MSNNVPLETILVSDGPSPDISTVVKHRDFPVLLQKGKPILLAYIVKHFDRILEIIFDEHHRDNREIRPHLSILECKEIAVKRVLVTSTKFVNYILEYPGRIKIYNQPSVGVFFNSLPAFILDTNNELLPFFANKDFFEAIIQNCDVQEAFVFMRSALSSRMRSFSVFFSQINVPAILILYVNGNSGLNLNVIKLFEQVIDRYPIQCANCVVQTDIITHIINSAFLLNCSQLIDFMNFLYTMSYKYKTESQWFVVEFQVDDRIPEICDYLLGTTKFDAMCKASANILLTYLRERQQQFPKVIYVAQKFAIELFQNPTNSFLHNTALQFLESVKTFPLRFNEIVENTNLCQKLVDAYKRRATDIGSCYWGALRKIANLIDTPINVSASDWSYVVNQNQKKERIIRTPIKTVAVEKINTKIRKKFELHIPRPSLSDIAALFICILSLVLYYVNHK